MSLLTPLWGRLNPDCHHERSYCNAMALSEEKLRELPPKAQAFWRKAFEFVAKNKTNWYPITEKETEQLQAWLRYFHRQGWEPWWVKQMRLGQIKTVMMPTEWPEWFDTDAA